MTYHGDLVLGRGSTSGVEVQTLLDLLLKGLTELGGGLLGEVVNSGGDGALVGKETRDATLVLGASSSNERGVVQKTVLGGVTLGLQGSEKGLLSTENLDRRSGVLGQVGQATGVGDQTSTNDLTNKGSKVGGDHAHLGNQVLVERLAVLGQADNALGERDNVLHVGLGNLLTHAVLSSVDDALGDTLIVLHKGSNVVQLLVVQALLVLNEQGNLGVALVVGDDLVEFGEVPGVPFPDSHGESVDGLVELVEDSNGLDDVVVIALNGELNLGARVSVTKTKLGGVHITLTQLLQQLGGVQSDTTKHILDDFAGVSSLAVNEREGRLDASSQGLVGQTQNNLLLLVGLGQVQFEERDQSVRSDTLGDIVDFTESLLVVPGSCQNPAGKCPYGKN